MNAPDAVVTHGQLWQFRNALRKRVFIQYVLVALMLLTITLYDTHQAAVVNRESYNRCTDRAGNTDRLNAFAQAMTAIEAGNHFVDQATRDRRVAQYTSLVLAPPRCGSRP